MRTTAPLSILVVALGISGTMPSTGASSFSCEMGLEVSNAIAIDVGTLQSKREEPSFGEALLADQHTHNNHDYTFWNSHHHNNVDYAQQGVGSSQESELTIRAQTERLSGKAFIA